jgi:adenine-specific DNA-methyltransferase
MGARYPYYLLADSPEGQLKEAEATRTTPKSAPTHNDIRYGFVYQRAPHITLKSIANNAEIDVIWERWQETLEPLRNELNRVLGRNQPWEEWEIPREAGDPWKPEAAALHAKLREAIAEDEIGKKSQKALAKLNAMLGRDYTFKTLPEKPTDPWTNEKAIKIHGQWWEARIARQKEIDASIAAKAEFEYLYDKPYVDNARIRVAGPFTVESLSPHRTLAVDWNDELIDILKASEGKREAPDRDDVATDFAQMILENLKVAGVQQAHREDRIAFTSLTGWPGRFICAEGVFMEGDREKRAGIFIGPEFGTVSRPDLVAAAREAGDAGFDVLIACAFNYDAHSAEFDKLGRVPVLKARMNPDLHMGGDLKATATGNLFVIFGEPDIKIEDAGDGMLRVKVFGVDVFKPQSGEVISEGTEGIALWMLDTDYNEESFFVRHAYFLGANDPYKALKTTLKAEIDEEAWESLYSDTSRPFPKPAYGRIAVKVINHLGDEVMKVFAV